MLHGAPGGSDDSLEEVARTFVGGGAALDHRPANHEWLLRNNGDGTFSDATIDVGLGYTSGTMGANFGAETPPFQCHFLMVKYDHFAKAGSGHP